MNLFCKHDWKIIESVIVKSTLDKMLEKSRYPELVCGAEILDRTKHICIVTCNKCGKLKKFVTDIPR